MVVMKKLTGEFILVLITLVIVVIFGKLWLSAYDSMMDQYEKEVEERVRIHEEMEKERIEHYRKYDTDEPVVIFLGNNPPEKKQ